MKKSVILFFALALCACTDSNSESVEIIPQADDFSVDTTIAREVYKYLDVEYLDFENVNKKDMEYGLARGLVDSLGDPYSEFLDPEQSAEFTQSLEGNLIGIGAELTREEDMIMVVSPLRKSPAEKAGLLPKDIILAVDDESVVDETTFEAVQRIRGEEGTAVKLSIWRESTQENLDIHITREEIHVPSVEWEWTENRADGIVHLTINAFNEKTSKEFFENMYTILYKNPKGLIIDLRYNGGGYLDDAVDVTSYFLEPEKVIVDVRGRTFFTNQTLTASDIQNNTTLPVVVLVNEGTASAAEIMAGALKDHGRAKIIGNQTYGKGTVQELVELSDGSTLRVTIAEWFTPNGVCINKEGITPDEFVAFTPEDIEQEKDVQLLRAIQILKQN